MGGWRALSPRRCGKGTWHKGPRVAPHRLSKMCHGYVGERGEAQIYGAHRRGPAALRDLLCHGDKGACAHRKAGGPAPPKALQNEL